MTPTPIQRRVLSQMLATGSAIVDAPEWQGRLSLGYGRCAPAVLRGTFRAMHCAGWLTPAHRDGQRRYVLSAAGERVAREMER